MSPHRPDSVPSRHGPKQIPGSIVVVVVGFLSTCSLVRLSDAVDSSALLSTRHVLVDVRRRNRTDPGLEARSQTGPHSSIRLHGVRVRVSIADCHSLDGSRHGRRSVESTVSLCVRTLVIEDGKQTGKRVFTLMDACQE